MSQLLSGKVKVVRPSDVSENRYEYLRLGEAEPNLGVPESGSLSSGSFALVASDADGNRLFVTTLQLESVTGSFSGSFAGDGSKLNNLPEATRIISGSASASITPQDGFLVNVSSSFDGDMDVEGDIRVTGDLIVDNRIVARELIVEIISSSIIFSTGSNKFGSDLGDIQEFTGSVNITGSLNVDGKTNITGGLGVIGDTDISGAVGIEGDTIITGSASILGSTNVSGAVDVKGITSLTGSVGILGDTNIIGSVDIEGDTTVTGSIFVSQSIEAKEFSGSFSGSGANLFDIPQSALSDNAPLIASGAVTASTENDVFRVTSVESGSIFSGSVFLSSGSVFSGSGRDLFDIPQSALATDAVLIASGAITASTEDNQFRVTSIESGSLFDGDVKLVSGSVFSGSGRDLFNIPRSALAPDALKSSEISSGSVTASVDPNDGFIVVSEASGSQFTGSIFLASGSFISGSGENLFNIPQSALATDAVLIASGAVTASTEDGIFRVTSLQSGSTFVGDVRVESGSVFSGSGRDLFDIPQSALSTDAVLIASGAVTASTENDRFIVTSEGSGSLFFGDIQLSSGSKFSGSGANLFNIPRAALTEDALETNLIISGAVTASVDPNDGFVVVSEISGSTFSGSVFLSSGSVFSGSGRDLFNIPRSALTEDALLSAFIRSGSVTASVAPDEGFVVTSLESGSTFIGDVRVESGSVFSGSGRDLFDIPQSALATDAVLIASGAVTASTENDIFQIISPASGSQITGSIFLASGSFISGSGEQLFDIPFSALSEDAQTSINAAIAGKSVLLASGSITASTEDNQFIVTSLESGSLFIGDVKLQSGSIFSGSGRDLFNIPFTALSQEAVEAIEATITQKSIQIASGSITASTEDNQFTVISVESGSLFTGDVKVTSGSVFSGSGRDLFDIPQSALATDAVLIASGAITASTENNQFIVTSTESGSLFDGDVKVTSGSVFSGSGRDLFDIPQSALATDAVLIASGAITASTENNQFIVTSTESGSLFDGDVKLVSGSVFSGSGRDLFDIPRSALTEDALISNVILSGSVTASIDGAGFFRVFSTGSVKSEFSGSVSISESLDVPLITADRVIANEFSGSFSGSGKNLFDIPVSQLSGDAFRIASGSATASISPVDGFVVNTSSSIDGDLVVTGRITTNELFTNFISSSIIYSSGSNIFGDNSGSDTQKLFGETQIFGNVTASGVVSSSGFVGDGSGLFNIPQSAISEDATLIASGAVTASTENNQFTVTSAESGSLFIGSIEIPTASGSLVVVVKDYLIFQNLHLHLNLIES
jgi:hypothetical protein